MYKQRVKHLLYEHQDGLARLKAAGEAALKQQAGGAGLCVPGEHRKERKLGGANHMCRRYWRWRWWSSWRTVAGVEPALAALPTTCRPTRLRSRRRSWGTTSGG